MMSNQEYGILHDARLFRIRSDESARTLVLGGTLVDGRTYDLVVSKVIDMCANNVRLGNIILSAEICQISDLTEAERRALSQGDSAHGRRHVERLVATHPEAECLRILSSYGCDLILTFVGTITIDISSV
jgi:hypothetical protein